MAESKKILAILFLLGLIIAPGGEESLLNSSGETPNSNNAKEKVPSELDNQAVITKANSNHINETKEVTLNSIGDHLHILEQRLVSIEEKIDHVLFHHSHDVTPHEVKWTPMGPQILPSIKNPNSAHHQMKIHDFVRGSIYNPYSYMGNMFGMGMGTMGFPPIF